MEGESGIIGRNLCGPACLQKVLEHFGQYFTVEELATACGTTASGTTAAQLIAAAQAKGLTATASGRSLASLHTTQFPAIAHWDGGTHFVVITELDFLKKFAAVFDPSAPRNPVLHTSQLASKYSGVVIEFGQA